MGTEWFREAKFGMFIHWGPYSVHGRCVWARYSERMPSSEYEKYAWRFNARNYHPAEWVNAAQEAGMKYVVLTTRQHPGFALFDSEVSDFTAPKMAANRDLVAEYVDACRKKGMRIGLYYSLLDWRYPAYFSGPKNDPEGWARFLEYVHAQVREICSNYGKIDLLWYDGWWPWTAEDWHSAELNAMVRSLQPDIVINNRSGLPEDYETPEQQDFRAISLGLGRRLAEANRPWESCITMNDHWGYAPRDRNWKTVRHIIFNLVWCTSRGGNLLLNVGPKADGVFPLRSVRRLKEIGRWMRTNGETIYGSERCPFTHEFLPTTAKGNTAYLHVLYWPGKEMAVANIKNKVLSGRILATGKKVDVEQKQDRVLLKNLPRKAPDPYDSVIALELDGKPEAYPNFRFIP